MLLGETDDTPCLSVFKRHLDNALNNVFYLLVSSEVVRQLDLMIFVGPFQVNYSTLLCSTLLYSTQTSLGLDFNNQCWLALGGLIPETSVHSSGLQESLVSMETSALYFWEPNSKVLSNM